MRWTGATALTSIVALAFALVSPPSTPAQDEPSPLSVEDALALALVDHPEVEIATLELESRLGALHASRSPYDFVLRGSLRHRSEVQPALDLLTGGDKVVTTRDEQSVGVSKKLDFGLTLDVQLRTFKGETNSENATFNPARVVRLETTLRQPLLRDRVLDADRRAELAAESATRLARAEVKAARLRAEHDVRRKHLALALAQAEMGARQDAVISAREQVESSRARVGAGTLSQLDLELTEGELAQRQGELLDATAVRIDAQEALLDVLGPGWTGGPIVVTALQEVAAASVSGEEPPLERRVDLVRLQEEVTDAESELRHRRGRLKPQLDVVATYGAVAIGGSDLRADEVIDTGRVFDEAGRGEFPNWSLGLEVTHELGRRAAKGSLQEAFALLEADRARLRRARERAELELQSARRAARADRRRLELARSQRELRERSFLAERRRFGAGFSSRDRVSRAQEELIAAEIAELRALAAVVESRIRMDEVLRLGG
ncbi:MAG: TolC family protein [Acidobacteriota bacterium]